MRLFCVHSTVDPYWIRYYDYLSQERSCELHAFFLYGRRQYDIPWANQSMSFPHTIAGDGLEQSGGLRGRTRTYRLLKEACGSFRPDLVICHGYNDPLLFMFCAWAYRRKTPVIQNGDSNLLQELSKPRLLRAVKRLYLNLLRRHLKGVWAMGIQNRLYWLYYGMPKSLIYGGGYYPVDVESFAALSSAERQKSGNLKRGSSPGGRRVILYVGRFAEVKNIPVLLEAFHMIKQRFDAALVLVGSGPEEAKLKSIVESRSIKNVTFAGPVPNHELHRFYGAADIYVQPSRAEPAGIVIMEAAACGLPIVASDVCGYSYEALVDGWNGYRFKEGDASDLASRIGMLLEDERLRQKMAERSSELAQNWTLAKKAESLEGVYASIRR